MSIKCKIAFEYTALLFIHSLWFQGLHISSDSLLTLSLCLSPVPSSHLRCPIPSHTLGRRLCLSCIKCSWNTPSPFALLSPVLKRNWKTLTQVWRFLLVLYSFIHNKPHLYIKLEEVRACVHAQKSMMQKKWVFICQTLFQHSLYLLNPYHMWLLFKRKRWKPDLKFTYNDG